MQQGYSKLILNVFKRTCDFSSESTDSRTTFVSYLFFCISCIMVVSGTMVFFADDKGLMEVIFSFDWRCWSVLICAVILFLPVPALIYRRIMDMEPQRWWLHVLLLFVPVIGLYPFAELCLRKGTKK